MVCILFFNARGARKNNQIKDYHRGNFSSFVNFLFSKLCEKGKGGALVSKIICFGKFSENKAPEHLAHFGCGFVWQRYCVIKLYKKKA